MTDPYLSETLKLVITGGGTGGHLFPGIAVAEAIKAKIANSEVLFIGTDRQVDNQVLEGRSFKTAAIRCQGIKGKSPMAVVAALFQLLPALWKSLVIIRRFSPDLVLGVGGYVTGPVMLAARILGVPTCIHEQNSVPGLANRLAGKIVDRVFLSLPGSEAYFPAGKTVLTGNPVRAEILTVRDSEKVDRVGPVLLVMGGSQGAHRVNQLVTESLALVKDKLPDHFRVIHQTGSRDEEMVRDIYNQEGIEAEVRDFFDDMASIYKQADLVISRAGATSLAELCVLGKAMLLIPFPYAADNHQEFNARMVVDRGGALMFKEFDLGAERLAEEMMVLLNDPERLREMGERAMEAAFPEATGSIVSECLALASR